MLPWQKSMRWVNCESEKGQASAVEKKGEISEALKFTWQKARPSGCRVRCTSSASSKEDLPQETLTGNPDRVAHSSFPNLYVEQTRSWSGYCQGLRAGRCEGILFRRFLKSCALSWGKPALVWHLPLVQPHLRASSLTSAVPSEYTARITRPPRTFFLIRSVIFCCYEDGQIHH